MILKADMKKVLEEAFAAPAPKRKQEFLKKAGQPRISTCSFLLQQISYIRKRVWIVSCLISVLAFMSVDFAGQDCIWVISALMPFIALCVVTETARSAIYNMAELEMASRFSLKSITLARLLTIGLLHFLILCLLIPVAGKSAIEPLGREGIYMRTGVYLFVPYILTSVLGLMAARKFHEKEVIYLCMGISVMVSYLNIIIKEIIPGVYEAKKFIWWCALMVYLLVKAWNEYKKTLLETEEPVWN